MGDDEVICLSSDDETTPGESSTTKSKLIINKPVKAEFASSLYRDKTIKRKAESQITTTPSPVEAKKTKVDINGSIEEIIIASPEKSTERKLISEPTPNEVKRNLCKADLPVHTEPPAIVKKSSLPVIAERTHASRPAVSRSDSGQSTRNNDASSFFERAHIADSRKPDRTSPSLKSRRENVSHCVKNVFAKPGIQQWLPGPSNNEKSRTSRSPQDAETRKIEVPRITGIGQKNELSESNDATKISDEKSRRRMEKLFGRITDQQPVRSRSPTATLFQKSHDNTKNIAEKMSSSRERDSPNSSDDWRKSFSNLPEVGIFPRVETSRASGSKTTRDNSVNGTTSLSPRSKDSCNTRRVDSSSLKILQKNHSPKFDSTKNSSEDKTIERRNSSSSRDESVRKSGSPICQISPRNETPKTSNRKNSSDGGRSDDSSRSGNLSKSRQTSCAITSNVLKTNQTSDARSAKNTAEKALGSTEKISSKINDCRRNSGSTSSPEVEIVDRLEIAKSSRSTNVDKISQSVGKIFAKSHDGQSSSESSKIESSKITKVSKTRNSDCSRITTESTLMKDKSDTSSRIMQKIDDPIVDDSKIIDDNLKRDSSSDKSISSLAKLPIVKSVEVVIRRITPTKLSTLIGPNAKKSADSRTKVSSMRNDESPKSSRSKDEGKTRKPFEPIAGCSKTPDETCPASTNDNRKKSSAQESFMTVPWKLSKNNETNQRPEASKSSADELEEFEKPRLIVRRKKAVVSTEQDKFAMFLGLCLQTDRSMAMEKIVAKLKRNYEQMDPMYARSRAFSDLVDDRREKIIAKGRVYYHIGHVAEEMKIRRNRGVSSKKKEKEAKKDATETNETDDDVKSSNDENENDENREESRRLRKKIKTIEMAMKKCSKRISELEVAEVDFDEDVNSNYIKLDRYKEKMVELYTQMCEYTNEHADAGRAYLRPQHLRVTQIPSIDQAINSFVNSKLSYNRKKALRGKSFVDGLVFPDYVDILECVGRVNDQQNLRLDKRRQQQLAQDAFTQLGKHLQNARQKDYWDTFSLDLEKGDDPASADRDLSIKLQKNQEIADKNTREIFEEYVRKQEEGNAENHDSSGSAAVDNDEDEDEEEEEEEEDDDDDENDEKKSDHASDVEGIAYEDEKHPDQSDNEDNCSNDLEKIPEVQSPSETVREDIEDQVPTAGIEDTTSGNGKVLETRSTTMNEPVISSDRPEETSVGKEAMEIDDIEDPLTDVRIEDATTIDNNNVLATSNTKIDDQVDSSDRRKDISIGNKTMINKETIPEARSPKDSLREDIEIGAPEVRIEDTTSENNNVFETSKAKIDSRVNPTDRPEEIFIGNEVTEISVNHAEPDTEVSIEPVIEQPRILRIRSFAKPPSSWASSQELCMDNSNVSTIPETTSDTQTFDVIDEESEDTTSLSVLKNASDPLRLDRPITFNSKNVVISRMEKINSKNARTIRPQPLSAATNRSSIIVRSPNQSSSSSSSSSSNIVKSVQNPSSSTTKQSPILPGLRIAPSNGQISQIPLRSANVTNSTIPGTLRNQNVVHNIQIPINSTNRVRSLDNPQRVQVKVAKNIRPITAGQLQVIRLSSASSLTRANTIEVTSPLQQRPLANSTNHIRFPVPVAQNIQTSQAHQARPVNPVQQVRIRVAGNSQILQPSQQQQQQQQQQHILRLSNGHCITSASPTIRSIDPSSSHITIRNPRIITIPGAATTAPPAAAAIRSTNNGQMRVERIENAPQRYQRSANSQVSAGNAQYQVSQPGQRNHPVLKLRTSNNNAAYDEYRRRGKRLGRKDFSMPPDPQPPRKK